MKRIAIDMDEVMVDILPRWLDLFEKEFGVRLTKEDYWGKKIYDVIKPEQRLKGRSFLFEKGFFVDQPMMKDCREVMEELSQHYEIFITTAAMEFRHSLWEKYHWLEKNLPFINWKNYVFCGDKSIINADYMIDDHASNLETFKGKGILYTSFHNVAETRFERVNNWQEVRSYFLENQHFSDQK